MLLFCCFRIDFAAQTISCCEDKLEADQCLATDTGTSSALGLLGFARLSIIISQTKILDPTPHEWW